MDITTSENLHSGRSKAYKILFLAITSIVLQVSMWLSIYEALYNGHSFEFWLVPVALAAVWIVFLSFFVITNNNRNLLHAVTLVGIVAYLAIFPKSLFVWLGGLVFALLLLAFVYRLKGLEKNQSHFSLRRLFTGSVLILTNALILTLGFNIYHNTNEDFKNDPEMFYDRLGQSAAQGLPKLGSGVAGDFNLDQTLDEFITQQFRQNPEEFENVSLEQYRNELLSQFNLENRGDESLASLLTFAAIERFKNSAGKYDLLFPLLFTLIVLGLLRTFAFIFNWFTALIGWLIFRLLMFVKFFSISKVQVEVDKLEI